MIDLFTYSAIDHRIVPREQFKYLIDEQNNMMLLMQYTGIESGLNIGVCCLMHSSFLLKFSR